MYCKYCGVSLPEECKFCPSCGKRLENDTATEMKAVEVVTPVVAGSETTVSATSAVTVEEKIFEKGSLSVVEKPVAESRVEDEERDKAGGSILTFAILGLAFGETLILSVLGLIFTYIARNKIKKYVEKYGETTGCASVGKGLSIAGLIVSWIGVGVFALYVTLIVFYALVIAFAGGYGGYGGGIQW